MISMYVSETHTNWDSILPFRTFAYKSARQGTTAFSPFHLLYGHEASCTLNFIFPSEQLDYSDEFVEDALALILMNAAN